MKAFREFAAKWLNAALGFLYPEICQLCGKTRATPAECFVCTDCRGRIRFIQPPYCDRCGRPFKGNITTRFECGHCRKEDLPFRSARSAVIARNEAREIIHRYKYKRELWFEPLLAGWLIQCAKPALSHENWDWIVPVPLHPAKEREREFNQAGRMAAHLAKAVNIPVRHRVLRRVIFTQTQTHLSREERRENVRHAFALSEGVNVERRRIILVDDVFTTGATTGACAQVLRDAGADDVCVWTVARGI